MLPECSLDVGDSALRYARGPASGPVLLLLHGVLRAWQDYLTLIPSLAPRWEVHALDFRGHGGSSRRSGRYRVIDYVEDAEAMLRHSPAPAAIYGHSLGAMVALAAAVGPEREKVRALVLEDPPFETVGRRIAETVFLSQFQGMRPLAGSTAPVAEIARAMADIELRTPGKDHTTRLGEHRDAVSLRFGAKCLKQVDPEVFTPLLAGEWLAGYDLDGILARVRCPVLLLQGDLEFGGMLRDDDALKLATLLPDCIRMKLDGVGHLMRWSRLETVAKLATTFLETV